MNILQISTVDKSGGAASIAWSLKNSLQKEGSPVHMFVRDKNSHDSNIKLIPQRIHKYFHYLFSNDIEFFFTDWIINTEEFKKADVVHFHNIHGWFFDLKTLQKISKIKPTIWTLHDMWAITPHCAHSYDGKIKGGFYQCPSLKSYPRLTWPNGKYLSWRKKNIYKNANFNLVVPSKWLMSKVNASVLSDKKIDLIYNGIDESIFKITDKSAARVKLDIPSDKKVVLYLSDGSKNNTSKGWNFVEEVVKVFKEDSSVMFICVGGDENGLDENYKNLFYVPKINEKEILASYFSASDLFLFPSLADNCPLVILEALSCGIPIVTFETGGIPELVTHKENGYIAKYKNTGDLISGVNYILKLNDLETKEIREKSRKKVLNNFTETKMVDKYKKLYIEVIKNFNKE